MRVMHVRLDISTLHNLVDILQLETPESIRHQ